MLKLGFSFAEIKAMPEGVADSYFEAYLDAVNPKKKRTYKVKRKR